MTDNTTQPVKDTTPANNYRNKNSFSNNHSGNNLQDITIWDGVVRLCHWGLVICFITNYFIVEPGRLYHEIAGYSAVFFVVVRIIWGFTRPPAESTYQDRHKKRCCACLDMCCCACLDMCYACLDMCFVV